MKKIVLLIALALGSLAGFSQLVELEGETNVVYGTTANEGEQLSASWEVINATDETIDLRCKRIGVSEVAGSVNQFCWGILCSPYGQGTSVSSEIVTLGPSEYTTSFYAHYLHNGNAGQSVIKYCWFDDADNSNEFCYDVNYCVDATCVISVNENELMGAELAISPNPIEKTGNITYSFTKAPDKGKLSIYNMVGGLVKEVDLEQREGVVLISAADFENGVYFCSITDNGHTYQTSRLVVAK
jgi:hypothetical protein